MTSRAVEPLNVLIIDDEEDAQRLLVDIVGRAGHQAIPVGSAEAGLALLPLWTFQVAFLDHHLPGMEGLVLGDYLRSNNPDMLVALVTGEDDPRIERRTRDLSIVFIRKPFEVEEILTVIDAYQAAAAEREAQRLSHADADFAPPFGRFAGEIAAAYDMPGVPDRIASRLTATVSACLSDLRTTARYGERGRVVALAGLLAARVLGLKLPKARSGRTLYEEYDAIMTLRGRRTEFEG